MSSSPCPSNSEVLRYLRGGTPADGAERLLYHLDVCDPCRVVVGEAARQVTRPDLDGQIRTLLDGELIGRYRIRGLVGRGGMGEVYEAQDEVLRERVALKTVRLAVLDNADALARFRSEVQLARKVSHPNVCRVLEFGLFERTVRHTVRETIPYLTMEFLEGRTLTSEIRAGGRLPWPYVAALGGQMAAGLKAIHDAGIVHRDFKSDNVVLVPTSDVPRALVTDFGLARLDDQDGDRRRSSADRMVGTVDYMAPEQIRGLGARPVSDVFALGVVLFEMLVGQRPHDGASRLELAMTRLNVDAPAVRQLVPGLPKAWGALLRRCLARDSAARFQTMTEVIDALRAIETGTSTSVWKPRWLVTRRRSRIIAAAIAIAAGTGGFVLRDRSSEPSKPDPRQSLSKESVRVDRPASRSQSAEPPPLFDRPGEIQLDAEARKPPPRAGGVRAQKRTPSVDVPGPPATAAVVRADSDSRPETGEQRLGGSPGVPSDEIVKPDFATRLGPARSAADKVVSPFGPN